MAVYDDDIFVEGTFFSNKATVQQNALEDYNEGDEVTLIYIPIREITYKDKNGFGIYYCQNNDDVDNPPTFVMCGTFTDHLDLGQTYKSDGTITLRQGSRQLSISNINKIMPTTKHGIISFMRSLDGMRFQADIIYDKFGDKSLDIIKNNPEEILKIIKGSYPEQVHGWKRQIDECKNNFGYLSDLIALGLRPAQAKKIYADYGEMAFTKIQQDPYFLIGKIKGYGFKRCDSIGKEMGIKYNDPERLSTGILYVLQTLMVNGSTCIPVDKVINTSKEELSIRMTSKEMLEAMKGKKAIYKYNYGNETYEIPLSQIKSDYTLYSSLHSASDKLFARTLVVPVTEHEIRTALLSLQTAEKIVIEDDLVFLKRYYDEEFNIAYYIQQISKYKIPNDNLNMELIVDKYCEVNNVELESKQREAVIEICKNRGGINIINGAAGCGKTFCIKIALNIVEKIYRKQQHTFSKVIIAPTGKAAQVAYKATGIDSYTIHKLLQYKPNEGFYYNAKNHLPYDCIVIDECSMLDTHLACQLFSAIDSSTKVIMMGDTNQLPSVGAGNVLHDFINSNKIPVTTLNVIKRQGSDSGIVINARNIINGQSVTTQKEQMDSIVVGVSDDVEYTKKIKKYCDKLLNNLDISELQILSPMKKGLTGTHFLNYLMQKLYNNNPDDHRFLKNKFDIKINDETKILELYFRVGDKVINTKNDYQAAWYYVKDGVLYKNQQNSGVTNGEVGTIVKMIESRDKFGDINRQIIVQFEDKYIIYENDFDNLELAYAITIHKSQGSEWAAVMVVLNHSHRSMIDRNLFYTGITRSKKMSIVVSDIDTIQYGVANTRSIRRTTGLQNRLNEMVMKPRYVVEDNVEF
jgi:exodeoxyribonuclease V alpha subunit